MTLRRFAFTQLGAILVAFGGISPAEAQDDRARVHVFPFAGIGLGSDADVAGALAGTEVAFRTSAVLWTPLELSAQFPSRGGYVRLAAGAAATVGSGYVGLLAGAVRFDLQQMLLVLRAGAPLPLARTAIAEFRLEHHERVVGGGTSVAVLLRWRLEI